MALNNEGTRWTRDDVRTLTRLMTYDASNALIADALGRSVLAVESAKRDRVILAKRAQTILTRTDRTSRTNGAPSITRMGATCPSCFVTMPVATGRCDTCD